jgi:hypothetical protein
MPDWTSIYQIHLLYLLYSDMACGAVPTYPSLVVYVSSVVCTHV